MWLKDISKREADLFKTSRLSLLELPLTVDLTADSKLIQVDA